MKLKTVFIVLGSLAIIFFMVQIIYHFKVQGTIESYPYKLIKTYEAFDTRIYEPRLFTTVTVGTANYKKASSEGFRAFAGYIFGGNDKKQAISMTSPVCMSLDNNTSTTMMFMLPKKIKTTISQNQIQRILNLKKNLQKK